MISEGSLRCTYTESEHRSGDSFMQDQEDEQLNRKHKRIRGTLELKYYFAIIPLPDGFGRWIAKIRSGRSTGCVCPLTRLARGAFKFHRGANLPPTSFPELAQCAGRGEPEAPIVRSISLTQESRTALARSSITLLRAIWVNLQDAVG